MNEPSLWNEPAGRRIIGYLWLLVVFCMICTSVRHCNRRTSARRENPWRNNDPSRPVTDIKALDYNRLMIIYRDEEPPKQLREFAWPSADRMYLDQDNCYEDYYEMLYEYYHD